MGIFSRKDPPMTEPEISGSEAIRLKVWSRWKRSNLSRTSLDLNISLAALEAFAKGERSLPASQLELLTKEFFYNARYDATTDKLIDTRPEPQVVCTAIPEPYKNPDPAVQAAQEAYHAALRAAAPAPVMRPPTPGAAPSGQFAKRPGFAT